MAIWDKFPSGETPTAVALPNVYLASESDSGVKGDQKTTFKTIKLLAGSAQSNLLTWLSRDGNSTFTPGVDIPTIAGEINNITLAPGVNTFTFYSRDLSRDPSSSDAVSQPNYYSVYLEPAAALEQESKLDETLNKVALAYLGRPVTGDEYSVFRSTLESANGDPQALIQSLAGNLEVHALYTVPTLLAGIDRVYNTLFGRSVTTSEEAYWNDQVTNRGLPILELPYRIADSAGTISQSASAADRGVLAARLLFMQQANDKFAENLELAGVSERTFLEIERAAVQGVKSISDVSKSYENLVSNAKNLLTSVGSLPAPTVALDSGSDSGIKGDFETAVGSVKINVSGTTPGALAWLDTNFNGSFDPTADSVVVNGAVYAPLNQGPNTLTFYQTLNGVISQPSYLALRRADPNTPTEPPGAPVLDLRTVDDDGADNSDNVTTKSLVRIDVSNLDPTASFAWLEKDGNGVYNAGKDIVLQTGASTATASVQLQEAGIGANLNGLSAYQIRAGLRSPEGALSVTFLKSLDVVKIVGGAALVGPSSLLTFQFDRPVDWNRLDTNADGQLQMGAPGSGAELSISIGGAPELGVTNSPSAWKAYVPDYPGIFLAISNVGVAFNQKPNTSPAEFYTEGELLVILNGIPDVSNQVTSDAWFSFKL